MHNYLRRGIDRIPSRLRGIQGTLPVPGNTSRCLSFTFLLSRLAAAALVAAEGISISQTDQGVVVVVVVVGVLASAREH